MHLGLAQRQNHIGPGLQAFYGSLADGVVFADGFHVQRIGDDDALKAQFFTQEPGEDFFREGGRVLFVQGGEADMGAHNRADLGFHSFAKGVEFGALELFQRFIHHWQLEVRVQEGVAVSGEMLDGSHYPGLLEAPGPGQGQPGYFFGVGAKAAVADHRVLGVGVHVHGGGKVPVDAQRDEGTAHRRPHRFGRLDLPHRAQGHRGGGQGKLQYPLHRPALLVNGNPGLGPQHRANLGHQLANLLGVLDVFAKQAHPPKAVALEVGAGGRVQGGAGDVDHHQAGG
ncbi:MAG: hypothetical protein KatS3mg071_2520 [Meiothermus sp.]|nr:MAG: hypothetical protein KatS3mg071_2520 [Meiothermus sp.]